MAEAVAPQVFTRRASGLVRVMSPYSAFIYNILTMGIIFPWTYLWAPTAFQGSNLVMGILFAFLFELPIALAYVWLATALPRSGGDYVFQSRVFGGGFGFTVVFAFFVVWILQWVALSGWLLASLGIAPTFLGLGVTTGVEAFTDIGTWAAGTTGIIVISIANALIALVLLVTGFRNYVRFQYVMWYGILISFAIVVLLFLMNDPTSATAKLDAFAADVGGGQNFFATARAAAAEAGVTFDPPFWLFGTLMVAPIAWTSLQWATYSVEQGGEIENAHVFRNQFFIIVGSLATTAALLIILAVAMEQGIGQDGIMVASSGYWLANDAALIGGNYMFPNMIAMGLTGSWIVVLLIGIGFILNSFQIVCNCYIGTTRIMVAQGLDGLLPDWFARVHPRWKTPLNAHLAYFLAALPVIWAFNNVADWATKWALGVTFANGAVMVLSALAAALLPYRARNVYEASPGARYMIGGLPAVTVIGVLGFLLGGFMVASFLFVDDLGLAYSVYGWFPYLIVLGTAVFGLVVYVIMRQVRAGAGLKVEYAFRETRRSDRPATGIDGAGPAAPPLPSWERPVSERARVVVVGGGVTGCSVALHLARAGWTDLLLLDKGELTSGSTAHAAGLVTMFNPSPTMMAFRRYSIELYGELGVFDSVGSLRIASSPESLLDLHRGVSRAKGIGLDVELLSPEETVGLMPAASGESLFGSVWVPADGFLDPHTATYALADAARALGARIRTNERVTGIELDDRRAIRVVRTERARIECEVVVDAAGIWAPRVAAMAGVRIPSTPVDHQHVALKAVPGSELPRDMPCFRDTDHLVYGKSEAGGVVFGGYEPDPAARWIDGPPWEHGGRSLPPDMERFEQLLRNAARRFPFIADAEIVKLVCHPDAMTPDANPLVGPAPTVRGLWFAAGLSLNGFGAAGGLGRALAGWIVEGDPGVDLTAYRPWRFGRVHEDAGWVAELSRETYRYYYRLRYPLDHDEWGRAKRLSPLHGRLQEVGAVFQAKHGWERPERFEPGQPSRRAGADQRAFGWSRPPWLDRVGEEHRAVRERAGLFDLSSFGKIDVTGPDALRLLDRAAANRVDVEPGRVVYTQLLDAKGGIVADVTVTRLAEERFRVTTGAAAVDGDLGWLRRLALIEGFERVELRDASEELAVIAVWGREAAEVLGGCVDVDPASVAPMTGREFRVGPVAAWAQAVSFAGEPGWELWVDPDGAVQAWDRLVDAGRSVGLEPCGYRCLDSLRIEKGFRYFGSDLTAEDTPLEAGLERFVSFEGRDFVGRDALLRRREAGIERRLRTLLVGDDPAYLRLYGGEAVLRHGRPLGRIRSAAYAFTIERNAALAYLPIALGPGDEVQVEVFGEVVRAVVADDVPVGVGSRT